jgi:hypothetical protein
LGKGAASGSYINDPYSTAVPMNKRIKALVEQARKYADENRPGSFVKYDPEWFVLYNEKFAVLIVKECADHCDLLLDHKISSEWSRGTHDCSRAIKKHFGVEE